MNVTIKTPADIEKMRVAGRLAAEVLQVVAPHVKPGVSTAQLDRIWTKYTQQAPPYGLRDPSIDERRVLFECSIDQIATFGQP